MNVNLNLQQINFYMLLLKPNRNANHHLNLLKMCYLKVKKKYLWKSFCFTRSNRYPSTFFKVSNDDRFININTIGYPSTHFGNILIHSNPSSVNFLVWNVGWFLETSSLLFYSCLINNSSQLEVVPYCCKKETTL